MFNSIGSLAALAAMLLLGSGKDSGRLDKPQPPAVQAAAPDPKAQPADVKRPLPAPAEEVKPADKPAEPDADFKYIPQSIQYSSYINFDQNGKLQSQSSNLSVGVRVQYKGKAAPVTIRNIQITRAATDAGEMLRLNGGMGEQRLRDWSQRQEGRSDFYLNLQFMGPTHQAKKFTEISGTFEIVCAKGQMLEGVLKPVADSLNKRIKFKDTNSGWLMFSHPSDNAGLVRIDYDMDMRNMLYQVVFMDENGKEVQLHGWNGGGEENGTEYRVVNIPLSEKGSIAVRLYPQVETKTIQFRIVDVPITPPDKPVPAADVVIQTHPFHDGMGPGDAKLPRVNPIAIEEQD